ncbi:metalloregulator ArsR/SmtB family transcription factor [Candidatus Bathyarchaeota archaeon]|nr:metalloregulator ArsR/SmtB family transcription factor [Candidatus Bathyarchaeota archaeon]
MKPFIIIKDPKVAKLFADKTRREILHNLRHREMTACQLAKILGKNVSSISHHLSVLEKAGLIEQTRTSVKGNLVEKYYRASAQRFIISYTLSEGLVPGSEDISKWNKEICKKAAENMDIFGFKVPDEKKKKIQDLIERYASLKNMTFENLISRQRESAEIIRPAIKLLISVLTSVLLFKNPEYQRIMEKLCLELGIEESGGNANSIHK